MISKRCKAVLKQPLFFVKCAGLKHKVECKTQFLFFLENIEMILHRIIGQLRSSGQSILVACVLLLATGWAAYWVYGTPGSNETRKSPLVVDRKLLNLGELWETKRFVVKLPVENRSADVVRVANIVTSCSCLEVEPRAFEIQPGEAREITLILDLTKATKDKNAAEGSALQAIEVEVLPILGSGLPAGESWPIRAQVRSPFRIAPAYIDFGPKVIRSDTSPVATLDVDCLCEMKGFTAVGKNTAIDVRLTGSPDSPSKFQLAITPNTSQPSGPFQTSVVLSAEIPDRGKVTREVPVVGVLVDEVYCLPDVLSFGAVPIGQTAEDVILLRSRRGQSFEIVGVDVDESSGLSVSPVASTGSPHFRITQKCSRVGPQNTQVRLIVRRQGQREPDTITLRVIHQGIPKA